MSPVSGDFRTECHCERMGMYVHTSKSRKGPEKIHPYKGLRTATSSMSFFGLVSRRGRATRLTWNYGGDRCKKLEKRSRKGGWERTNGRTGEDSRPLFEDYRNGKYAASFALRARARARTRGSASTRACLLSFCQS